MGLTQGRTSGKLTSGTPGVVSYADASLSPTAGSDYLFADAPFLHAQCNPGLYIYDHDDFIQYDTTATVGRYLATTTGGVTSATHLTTAGNGVIEITTNSTANNGYNIQDVCPVGMLATSGKDVWFECLSTMSNATTSNFYIGLGLIDGDWNGTGGNGVPNDAIYFFKARTATTIAAITKATTSTSTNCATVCATSQMRFGIRIVSNTSVKFYINNVLQATHTLTIPAGVACVRTWEVSNGAGTTSFVGTLDAWTYLAIR